MNPNISVVHQGLTKVMGIFRASLRTQLNIILLLMMLLSFLASLWVNVSSVRGFLDAQLQAHAQDTATSLGLSLQPALLSGDEPALKATVNAIFDRGYFEKIRLLGVDGNLLYERSLAARPEAVPSWFIELFPLSAPVATTQINTGWTIGGVLSVQAHPGLAYRQLWLSALDSVHMTLALFCFALLAAYLLLRQVYKPIEAVVAQSEAVARREFILIEQQPRARELSSFVTAMNTMVIRLKGAFVDLNLIAEQAKKDAYEDVTTRLANRKAFDLRMQDVLDPGASDFGFLLLFRFELLKEFNLSRGYEAGDRILRALVDCITENAKKLPEAELFRFSGSEFVLLAPGVSEKTISACAEATLASLKKLDGLQQSAFGVKGLSVGISTFSAGQDYKRLLYNLDMVTLAAASEPGGIKLRAQTTPGQGASELKQVIEEIIQRPRMCVRLQAQAVESCTGLSLFGCDIYAAFVVNGVTYNTADVFAAAQAYGLAKQLDLAVLKSIALKAELVQKYGQGRLAFCLSQTSLHDADFVQQLAQLFEGQYQHYVVCVNEQAIISGLDSVSSALEKLRSLGFGICVNRFGSSTESLRYLAAVRPDFVRLDPVLTKNNDVLDHNKPLLTALIALARSMQIAVIAQRVEVIGEAERLKLLGVDGLQGFYIGRPEKI
ncbi:bifunctional diguanylate cyclase/phosphodiesterase [Agaribacterium haliotis]|uniref:bifunctional diguanylate cyclase/phosphodiesterase n=1 Tax=Agaribacterium haliotis TaxID=2013869 RepID=UPI000BB59C63|nr:LapD/MoxY N-terminal periplasmic domain-containing protein [Agaribacterium haliotis]